MSRVDCNTLEGVIDVLSPTADTSGAVIDAQWLHEQLIEAIVETDEGLMAVLDGRNARGAHILLRLLPQAVVAGELIPVFCVCAKNNVGLEELLTGLEHCMPSPEQVERHGGR